MNLKKIHTLPLTSAHVRIVVALISLMLIAIGAMQSDPAAINP